MAKGYKDLLLKEVLELFKKLPPNVRLRVYYEDMGKSKYTLNQIGDALFEFIKATNTRFDNLENNFNSFKQEVDARFDKIEKRLDYNGLQIERIEKRLDYNGLQIERIEKRLDYNNLKKLPESR